MPILVVDGVVKRFGGLNASDGINLQIFEGELHALIGPNGAGKTTLVAQLSGLVHPDSGTITFKQKNVTRLSAHKLVQKGLARSFQITSIFPDMTVRENVAIAVQAKHGHSFKFFSRAALDRKRSNGANDVLKQVGIYDQSNRTASQLSHGEKRQLEIAMALATDPELLLLDEPMAGMGQEEVKEMIALLSNLKKTKTILMIEHNMDVVFALADRISVLVEGRVIATDTPDAVRANAEVRRAYLGEDH